MSVMAAGLFAAGPIGVAHAESPAKVEVVTEEYPDDFFSSNLPGDETDRLFEEIQAEEWDAERNLASPVTGWLEERLTNQQNPPQAQSVKTPKAPAPQGWWRRAGHQPRKNDVMLWLQGGGHAAGGFWGGGLEWVLTSRLALRYAVQTTSFNQSDFSFDQSPSSNWNFFSDGRWAGLDTISPRTATDGRAHLMDLSVVGHLLRFWWFDVYATFGISHFGYNIDFKDAPAQGGEGYGRFGAGANFHLGRVFAGVEFGWHPLALFRYARNADAGETRFIDIDDRWDSRRVVTRAHLGLRF